MNAQTIEARFGIMVDGRVAEVHAAAVHAVLILDEAHGHLVDARVVAVPPPSERWYRLLDQFGSEVADSAPCGETTEHSDRLARDLFVMSAAFLAAEANDLEDRISLLTDDLIRSRLDDIADQVGSTADAFIDHVEGGAWRKFSTNVTGAPSMSKAGTSRQPTRLGSILAVGKIACPTSAVTAIVVITLFVFFDDSLPWGIMIVVATLLGLLLGATCSTKTLEPQFRRQAAERRSLNLEWSAIRAARRQLDECPRCGLSLPGQDQSFASALTEERLYDDN